MAEHKSREVFVKDPLVSRFTKQRDNRILVLSGTIAQVRGALDRARDLTEANGVTCLSVSCADTYSPIDLLFQALVAVRPEHLSNCPQSLAPKGNSERRRRVGEAIQLASQSNRIEAMRQVLVQAHQEAPLALFFEDVQWADNDTLEVLEQLTQKGELLARTIGTQALPKNPTVCLGYGVSGAEERQHASDFADSLGAEEIQVETTQRPFFEERISRRDVVDRLLTVTQGDPDALEILLRSLPENPAEWVEQRLTSLPESARNLAGILTLCRNPIRPAQLARVSDYTEVDVRRALLALSQAGFLMGEGELTLHHGVPFQRFKLDPEQEKRCHEALGELRAQEWTLTRNERALEEAAHHFLQAGEKERFIAFGLQAMDSLEFRHQLGEATLLGEALEKNLPYDHASHQRVVLRLAELAAAQGNVSQAMAKLEGILNADHRNWKISLDAASLLLACGEPQTGLHTLEELGEELPDSHREAFQHLQAEILQSLGRSEEALSVLNTLPSTPSRSLLQGNIHLTQGRDLLAHTKYREVAQDTESTPQIRALHNLGVVAIRKEDYTQALRLLQQALSVCHRLGEQFGAALCKLNLAIVYEHLERFGLAQRFFTEAVDLLERQGRLRNLAGAMAGLADLYRRMGDPRRAIRILREALKFCSQDAFPQENADCMLKLGYAEFERGCIGTARAALGEALNTLETLGHPIEFASGLLLLAECEHLNGNTEAAQNMLTTLREMTLDSAEVEAQRLVIEAQLEPVESSGRLATLEAALEQARASKQREVEIHALLLLSQSLKARNREQDAEAASNAGIQLLEALKREIPLSHRERFAARRIFGGGFQTSSDLASAVAPPSAPLEETRVADPAFQHILGDSPALTHAIRQAKRVAQTDETVLITGESGTGKELFAAAMVASGKRKNGPFIRVNAAALTDTLLESELFGHEKGAFTGASERKKGQFELANRGTLFLDEIGDISPRMQVSLLRVLQQGEVQRIGSSTPVPVDVRILCATNKDLEQLVRQGQFRLDLYYRIATLTLALPPLRERKGDIALLAQSFLERANEKCTTPAVFDAKALQWLTTAPWQGNIRELQNVITGAVLMREKDTLEASYLQTFVKETQDEGMDFQQRQTTGVPISDWTQVSLDGELKALEKKLIRDALESTDGNITKAARLLKMTRPRLSQKIKEYGLK